MWRILRWSHCPWLFGHRSPYKGEIGDLSSRRQDNESKKSDQGLEGALDPGGSGSLLKLEMQADDSAWISTFNF